MLRRMFLLPVLWLVLWLAPGPKNAVDINWKRWYSNPNRHDGVPRYRSVTNVTGALPKMALLHWAANTVARYAVDHKEAWTGLPEEDQYDLLRKRPWDTRDRAGAKGTTVHAVAHNLALGRSYEVEALLEPWVHAIKRFWEDYRPRVKMAETTGYSERTLTAGTIDLLCTLEKAPELGTVLLDWKTSRGIYGDMAVQIVGGYALGFEYTLDGADKEKEWKPPDTCAVVHLQQTGYDFHVIPMDKVFRRAFLGCLEIRKWEDEGPPIGEPYVLKQDPSEPTWDKVPGKDEIAHLKARLSLLDADQRLALMAEADSLGITTIVPKMMVDDVDRILGLTERYPITEARAEEIRSRPAASRPMP